MRNRLESIKYLILPLFVILLVLAAVSCERRTDAGTEDDSQDELTMDLDAPSTGIPGASGILLFEEDFEDGNTDGWVVGSTWNIYQPEENTILLGTGFGGAYVQNGQDWSGYLFRTAARVETGSLFLSFNLTQDGRYLLALREDGMYLVKEQPVGEFSLLAHTGPVSAAAWHSVTVANQGGHLQVYIDRVLWVDIVDPEPLQTGTIGVSTLDDSRVGVDNILVLQLMGDLPAGQTQAPEVVVEQPVIEEIIPPSEEGGLPVADVVVEAEVQVEPVPEQIGGKPELLVYKVTIPRDVIKGRPVSVSPQVVNVGTAVSGLFTVEWYPENSFVGCSWDVPSLGVHESLVLLCDYIGYPQAGDFIWGISVDTENEVDELNESNNDLTSVISVVMDVSEVAAPEEQPTGDEIYAPTNCQLSGVEPQEIWINWDYTYDGEPSFRVYIDGTLYQDYFSTQQRGSYISGLTAGTEYLVGVSAYSDAGESEPCTLVVTTETE